MRKLSAPAVVIALLFSSVLISPIYADASLSATSKARFGFGSAGNATETTIFTAIGNQTIESLVITNTSTTERAVRIHVVASGGTAAATNAIFMYDWVIEAGNSITINTEFGLLPGDFLQARADGTGVTVAVSGRFSG